MGAQTKIEWTDNTFNPWIGCSKVSAGCANCYAERDNARRKWNPAGWGNGAPRKRTSESNWSLPRGWNRMAVEMPFSCLGCGVWSNGGKCFLCGKEMVKRRPRVFCASLADWLDSEVAYGWLLDLLMLIAETDNLDWLLLTKRPENWLTRLRQARNLALSLDLPNISGWIDGWLGGEAPRNVWFGISAENQPEWDRRKEYLHTIPAQVTFVSAEPMLGAIDLGFGKSKIQWSGKPHWVICGGESGPHARAMHPDWARSLRDQCKDADIAFLFKQWGEFVDLKNMPGDTLEKQDGFTPFYWNDGKGVPAVYRVGKKAAGRLLDGRTHDEFPNLEEVPA